MPLLLLILSLCCWGPASKLSASELEDVLASMDKSASSFRDLCARLKRQDHTAVINDTTEETGKIQMRKVGKRGAQMRIDFDAPDTRTAVFADRKAQIYYPKIQTVQIYDLGKYRELVDQFLLLGFGTSGQELQNNYLVRMTGEEKVSGEAVTRLELKPRAASAREHLDKVELWVAAGGYPVQQKFYRPSGDYTLITYVDLKFNPGVSEQAVTLKLPSGVKREFPQK